MSYPLLKQGDRLPSVGVVQKLLNSWNGKAQKVDGVFGRKTTKEIIKFQKLRKINPSGQIDELTWKRLAEGRPNLKVIDCIDVFDPDAYLLEVRDIRTAGGKPILVPGMSGGLEKAIAEIIAYAGKGKTFLLRFHGHGNGGLASMGSGAQFSTQSTSLIGDPVDGVHGSDIDNGEEISPGKTFWRSTGEKVVIPAIRTNPLLFRYFQRLSIIFGVYGCIEFMHCNVCEGTDGRKLVSNVSRVARVPASGSPDLQFGGGLSTFRLEGRTYTHFPNKQNLRSWCRSRIDFPKNRQSPLRRKWEK